MYGEVCVKAGSAACERDASIARHAGRVLVNVLASLALAFAMLPSFSLVAPTPAFAADSAKDAHGAYIGITADGDYVDVSYSDGTYTCNDASGADVTASCYIYQVCVTTTSLGTVATLLHVPDDYTPVSMPAKHVGIATETAEGGTTTSDMTVESKNGGSYAVTGSTLDVPDSEGNLYIGITTDGEYVDVTRSNGIYTSTDAQGNVRSDVWVWKDSYYSQNTYRNNGVSAKATVLRNAFLCAVPDNYKSGDSCPHMIGGRVQGRYGTLFDDKGLSDLVICKDMQGEYVSATDSAGKTRTDIWKWTISALGSSQANGSARLVQIPATFNSSDLELESQVASANGNVYEVTFINSALQNFERSNADTAAAVKNLSIPATLNSGEYSVLATRIQPYFSGLETISANDGGSLESTIYASDDVLFSKTGALLLYPRAKADEAYTVPDNTDAIGAYAFYSNAMLQAVTMPKELPGLSDTSLDSGIGVHAFDGCANLATVNFPEDASIGFNATNSSHNITFQGHDSIGDCAFKNCASLTSICLPSMNGARKGNIWHPYDTQLRGTSGTFNTHLVSDSTALGDAVFEGCTGLTSVTFEAGCLNGMIPYFAKNAIFTGCVNLKSVIFTDVVNYWHSSTSGYSYTMLDDDLQYYDRGESSDSEQDYCSYYWTNTCGLEEAPTVYCAVDYYITEEEAASTDIASKSRDAKATGRLGRMEFARGTSTASISTNDRTALASAISPDTSYVSSETTTYADGDLTRLDPNAVASENATTVAKEYGIEASAVATTAWCWKLGYGQQNYNELTDSCYAWLAPRNDLSSGRVTGKMMDNVRDYNYASHLDTLEFDEIEYMLNEEGTSDAQRWGTCAVITSEGPQIQDLKLLDASGNEIPSNNYVVTYERCAAIEPDSYNDQDVDEDGELNVGREDYQLTMEQLGSDEVPRETGLYRVTYTYSGNDGIHTGSLQQWMVFVANSAYISAKNHMGGSSAAYTAERVRYAYSEVANGRIDYSSAPYEVSLVEGDVASAVIASAYAGLVRGHIEVKGATDDLSDGLCIGSGEYARTYQGKAYSDSEMANWVFEDFEDSRRSYGAKDFDWGDTAVLCSPSDVYDTASISAYAYTKKAPVFFTEPDGTVSEDTLDNLAGFAHVAVAGGTQLVSDDVTQQLAAQTCTGTNEARGKSKITRIGASVDAGDACGFSLAVADALASSDDFEPTLAAVSDGSDPLDCIAALGFCAHGRTGLDDGFSLVATSTLDSKRMAAFLHAHQDEIEYLRVYGRSEVNIDCDAVDFTQPSDKANLENLIGLVWSSDDAAVAEKLEVAEGDTVVLYGIQFTVGAGGALVPTGVHFGDVTAPPAACSLTYDGATYTYTAPEAVSNVLALIEALPDEIGLDDKAAVEAARAAYGALSKSEKALVSDEAVQKLEQAEAAVATVEEKAAEDALQAAVNAIESLPANAGVNDKKAVEAARAAYEALTEEQKASVPSEVLQKLKAAEASVNKAEQQANAGLSVGKSASVGGSTYKAIGKTAVALTKAKNAKSVTVPATVKIRRHSYKVTQIAKKSFTGAKIRAVTIGKNVSKIASGAFAKSKVTTLIVKTKKLKKPATVKNSFKGSKAKKVTVKRSGIAKSFVSKSFTKKNTKAKKMVMK